MRLAGRTLPATAALVVAAATLIVAAALGSVRAQDADRSYAHTPERLRPYAAAGEPARRFFTAPPEFRGPGRDAPPPEDLTAVRIGVLAPRGGRYAPRGERMLRGVNMAIDEANAAGGYADGLPFELIVRNESQSWGAAASEAVDLVHDQGVVGLIGALDDAASHVVTRVLLKIEVPLVNTGGVDPTLTEHAIPWLVRVRPDDRQACYGLALRVFDQDARRRVVVFRENSRYARVGIVEFVDAARRLGHPALLEVRFETDETEWAPLFERIRSARPDALFVWGDGPAAGRALAELRKAGIDLPVYGPERLTDRECLDVAGAAAEGVVFTRPFAPEDGGALWTAFAKRYDELFGEAPDVEAAYGYDGARRLLDAIHEAGPNRVRIRDALFARRDWSGVTGPSRLDTTGNVVREVVIGHVANGRPVLER